MDRLSKEDMALWDAWKRAAETVRARVAEDVAAATGLSDPDFGVLTRVTEDGRGRVRQNQLADSMGWHRSRLSHHLSRMEQRGLVTRRPVDGGVEVVVTDAGRAEAARARPVHARAVRAHLVERLGKADRATFFACLEALTESRD